ncbi:MAG: hypothetical protein ACT4QF_17905 [Sporichthyaceae bacterium]
MTAFPDPELGRRYRAGEDYSVFPATRSRLGTITALAFDATLTVLSEPIHRGSLANARNALEARRTEDLAAQANWRQFSDRNALPTVAARPRVMV